MKMLCLKHYIICMWIFNVVSAWLFLKWVANYCDVADTLIPRFYQTIVSHYHHHSANKSQQFSSLIQIPAQCQEAWQGQPWAGDLCGWNTKATQLSAWVSLCQLRAPQRMSHVTNNTSSTDKSEAFITVWQFGVFTLLFGFRLQKFYLSSNGDEWQPAVLAHGRTLKAN